MIIFAWIARLWASPHSSWILLCALAVAILFGWHEYAIHEAVAQAHREDAAAIDKANAEAKAAHDATQAQIDQQAQTSNAAINAKVDAISRDTNAIKAKIASLKPTTYKAALPATCVFDEERIRDANEALQR